MTSPEPAPNQFDDPRMRGFRKRSSVAEARDWIDAQVKTLSIEEAALQDAAGRVLAREILSGFAMPPFDRAAMDGFALPGGETAGASSKRPAEFRIIGRSRPGQPFNEIVGPGQAVEIATGAPMPEGADAVARVETTDRLKDQLLVQEPALPGRHVGHRGEDVAEGALLLRSRRMLRPQDLGILSAQAVAKVPVYQQPRVAILITGEELLPPGSPPEGARIADMNSPMLRPLIERDGGRASVVGPLADHRDRLREAILQAAGESDVILISGGSSTGPEDHAPGLIAELGRLPIHGVAIRPASPTGLGLVGDVPVVLLPGNPVSCLCAYDFFAGRVIRRLGGRPIGWPYRSKVGRLVEPLPSVLGRTDYARVHWLDSEVQPIAVSGASILSSTSLADGFVVIPDDRDGFAAGSEVTVWLYDSEDPPRP